MKLIHLLTQGISYLDLLSDMRPKGRGRPQRILLGSWPEDHIRGVIRAVVFRDNAKDDLPFVFNRVIRIIMIRNDGRCLVCDIADIVGRITLARLELAE